MRRQSWVQHAVDVFWHYPGVQHGLILLAAGCVLAVAALAGAYIRQRRERGSTVPSAPTGREPYSYFRGQWRRSLTLIYVVLSAGGLYGLWAVYSKSWVWYPFLGTLLVMVPWTVYMAVVTLRRPTIDMSTHHATVADLDHLPSVDVFICVCGEDREVVASTFRHVRQLMWPGELTVYVLDDSPDESFRDLARHSGFLYVRRPDRPFGKKSGNLNHGFQRSRGEFVAVFDADFAPAPSFLEETVPYFAEGDVGIVQTSQYFSVTRRDTVNWIARLGGVVQGMFFCWSQPGQQSRDSAFCVGTNVLYRRAAVDAAGGIPICDHGGEDIVTSVHMLALCWRTVYVPLNLARGLCPDTFTSAVNQQYRWALTTFALIFPVRGMGGDSRKFWACRMTRTQRISYLSGLLYYGQSLLTLVIGVMPALIMVWVYPFQVGPGNYLPIAPAMLSMATLPLMVPGWRPEMLRLSVVYAVAHLLAAWDAVTGRVQGWVPTGSTRKPARNRAPRRAAIIIRGWVVVTQGLMGWALARDLPIYGMPAYWIPLALAIMQAVILVPLLLPGYGTVGFRLPRRQADDFDVERDVQCAEWPTRPFEVDVLCGSAGRRESGVAVLRARGGQLFARGSGDHRKQRHGQLQRVERGIPVSVGEGVDEREV